ncbi:T-complex protein 11 homolog isoform X1 [Rattus norvegicus]|uniref:T-complex protein 11 homolog n=1 Tax=Rattus norvegicus TaxID=10116 RepID=TCP11_RAT|nr:T-complex protein 11 homolog [Rattus norvegicus]XP_017457133.1 T-complex protein 11 homolog isoform X1 [Rattus norvegicus]Q5XI00.1 RecName: Full=T-complex protein 11 homolog [Rattus norvegicus]AAH83899.1 T-complex protein 11 [Rattus norvegicus]|eukprot:NP_001007696.1 T-complex protein 11 homolog [Rattus norvegicus]
MPDLKERAARKEPGAAESASRESRGGNTRESASSAQGHRSRRFNRRSSTAALTPGSAQGRGVQTAPRAPVGHGGLRTGLTSRCPQPSARAKLPSVTRGAPLPPSPGKGHFGATPISHRLGLTERVHDASKLDCHLEDRKSASSLESRGKEVMPSDFWDHLKEQLSAVPPDFSCALELLKEIKEILLSLLLPRQSRLRNEIEEALDMEFLHQQADRGDLNVSYLSKYILNMMVLLCAPVRDEAVQRLENISDPVRLLRGIFQVLGQMKMDMVNYTIQSLQPQLQEHSIQFERAQFQERLNKDPSLLNHTTKWLTQAATQLIAPSGSCYDIQDPSSSSGPSPSDIAIPEPLSPAMVLSQGFLNLLTWDPENEEFPETLLADRSRLQELESQQNQLTILASVLLVASSFSGSVLFGSPQFVDRLKRITKSLVEDFNSRPEEVMQTVSDQVTEEIHQSLKNMGLSPLSSENTDSLIGQLQNIAKKENCVRSVIDQRIHLFLKCCFVLGVQRSLLDLPGGLSLIEAELAELGQKFVSLTHHNQQVFAPYYTEILKTLINPVQTLTTKVGSL